MREKSPHPCAKLHETHSATPLEPQSHTSVTLNSIQDLPAGTSPRM